MKVKDLLSSKHNRDFYFGLDNALRGGILKLHVSALLIDDEIVGILPLPNRMVYFPAKIMHRATSFRDRHRFTLALKYGI